MAKRRLDINWGGHKDGTTFNVAPELIKADVSDFIAQPAIAKLRTGVCVTRDSNGYVVPVSAANQIVMGIISFGFADRLGTRERANANSNEIGEGLTVVNGRGGLTLSADMFDDGANGAKSGQKVYVALSNGKPTLTVGDSDASLEIGYVSDVDGTEISIEFKL